MLQGLINTCAGAWLLLALKLEHSLGHPIVRQARVLDPEMVLLCAGTTDSACRFSRVRAGDRAGVASAWRCCVFCDLGRLEEAASTGSGRANLKKALKAGVDRLHRKQIATCPRTEPHMLPQAFLQLDEAIFDEAVARIGEVTPDAHDLERDARQHVALSTWTSILAHRKRLRADPPAEEEEAFRERVEADRRRVRNKFFPSKAGRLVSHSYTLCTLICMDEAFVAMQCCCLQAFVSLAPLPGQENLPQWSRVDASNAAGSERQDQRPRLQRYRPAGSPRDVPSSCRRTLVQGSWSFCMTCHSLRPRHLKEADLARLPAPCTHGCPACFKAPAPWIPKVDDVPARLCGLARSVALALCGRSTSTVARIVEATTATACIRASCASVGAWRPCLRRSRLCPLRACENKLGMRAGFCFARRRRSTKLSPTGTSASSGRPRTQRPSKPSCRCSSLRRRASSVPCGPTSIFTRTFARR